jgi:hypothetical protein
MYATLSHAAVRQFLMIGFGFVAVFCALCVAAFVS